MSESVGQPDVAPAAAERPSVRQPSVQAPAEVQAENRSAVDAAPSATATIAAALAEHVPSAADLDKLRTTLADLPEPLNTELANAAALPGGLVTVRDVLKLTRLELDLRSSAPRDPQLLTGNAMDEELDSVEARQDAQRWLATCRRFTTFAETALTASNDLATTFADRITEAQVARERPLGATMTELREAAVADVERWDARIARLKAEVAGLHARAQDRTAEVGLPYQLTSIETELRHLAGVRILAMARIRVTETMNDVSTWGMELADKLRSLRHAIIAAVSNMHAQERKLQRVQQRRRGTRLLIYAVVIVVLGVAVDVAVGKTRLAGVLMSTILALMFWFLDNRFVSPRLERMESASHLREIVDEVGQYGDLLVRVRLMEGTMRATAALVDVISPPLLGTAIFDLADEIAREPL